MPASSRLLPFLFAFLAACSPALSAAPLGSALPGGHAALQAWQDNTPLGEAARQTLVLINIERRRAGCPALSFHPQLIQAAHSHSSDMARNRFLSHVGSGDRHLDERLDSVGYNFQVSAENVAAGRMSPLEAVRGWMNSPSHRVNIVDCSLRETGVAIVESPRDEYGLYWTQIFGTRL